MTPDAEITVSGKTLSLIRHEAARVGCTVGELVDTAVVEYVLDHTGEIEAGFDHAREVLGDSRKYAKSGWWHRCWRCGRWRRGLYWRGGASIGCVSWEHRYGDPECQ